MDIDFLSLEDLLEIAQGVLPAVEVRDVGLLESASARPRASVLGEWAYPSFEEQAGALMHSLARNHPLVDGNKRLAWAATRTFFLLNGRDLTYDVDEAEEFVLAVARGELEVPSIADWLRAHSSAGTGQ
ncbi:MAG: type II toxin-antitoxin system death-on-curing family toxin [Actinobacteria bacterium]|nr:type II toxin-antitoxin system death-on-curing family toxin [Actinomycetota bacterium]